MGRFNKIAPTNKGFNKSKDNWRKNKNEPTDSTTNTSFFISSTNNSKSSEPFFVSKNEKYTKTSNKNEKISPTRTNLNDQQGFKISENKFKNKQFNNKKNPDDSKFKDGQVEKKPFNKRKWRLQKYSKKYKLEQWEEKRKKAILRGYYKEIKDEKPKMDVQKIYEQYNDDSEEEASSTEQPQNFVQNPNYKAKIDADIKQSKSRDNEVNEPNKSFKQSTNNKAYNKAHHEFERLKQEKIAKKEERIKQKEEREEALKLYKKKKQEKFKKLNKKTKKGQPIMKDRIEMLLEKIQSG